MICLIKKESLYEIGEVVILRFRMGCRFCMSGQDIVIECLAMEIMADRLVPAYSGDLDEYFAFEVRHWLCLVQDINENWQLVVLCLETE